MTYQDPTNHYKIWPEFTWDRLGGNWEDLARNGKISQCPTRLVRHDTPRKYLERLGAHWEYLSILGNARENWA